MKKIFVVCLLLMTVFMSFAAKADSLPNEELVLKNLNGSTNVTLLSSSNGVTIENKVALPQKSSDDVGYHYTGTASTDIIGGSDTHFWALNATDKTLTYAKTVVEFDVMAVSNNQGVILRSNHWNADATANGGNFNPLTLIVGEDIEAGKWYKIAVEYDGANATGTETSGKYTIYINGNQYKSGNMNIGYFKPRFIWFSPYIKKDGTADLFFDNLKVYGTNNSYSSDFKTAEFSFENSDSFCYSSEMNSVLAIKGSTAEDLLKYINLTDTETVGVYANGKTLKTTEELEDNDMIVIFDKNTQLNNYIAIKQISVNDNTKLSVDNLSINIAKDAYTISGCVCNPDKTANNIKLLAVSYGFDGKVMNAEAFDVAFSNDLVVFSKKMNFKQNKDYACIKAFALLSFESMKPLCQPATVMAQGKEVLINDETVRFVGRTLNYDDTSYSGNWPMSGIEFEFTGVGADVDLSYLSGTVFLNVSVDGSDECYRFQAAKGWNKLAEGLEYGKHTIKLTRSSEGSVYKFAIDKLRVYGADTTSPTNEKNRTMEFIGDSYTVGYGNLEYGAEQPNQSAGNTDGWRSYASYCARELNADLNIVAYSGKGVCINTSKEDAPIYTSLNMTDQYDYAEPRFSADVMYTKWDFEKYTPDVVVVFLGRNDYAGSKPVGSMGDVFEKGYIEFLNMLRAKNPQATIVACSRPTLSYEEEVQNAVNTVGGIEKGFYHYVFKNFGTSGVHAHPHYTEDEKMGKELAEFINSLGDNIWD